MSGRLVNPYAKKNKRPLSTTTTTAAAGTATNNNNDDRTGSKSKNARTHGPSTNNSTGFASSASVFPESNLGGSFSQAFASVEDSAYFQDAIKTTTSAANHKYNSKELKDRAEQRAMDATSTSTGTTTAANKAGDHPNTTLVDPNSLLSDREIQLVGVSAHPHVLYVSPKQRGNIVLQYIRNVPMEFSRMVPDYLFSATQCALFLSLKYHSLYPRYICGRMAELQSDFTLRLLLVLVDVQDNAALIRQLNELAVTNRMSLLLAWTAEEAGRYLETFKSYQGKDASLIQKRSSTSHADQVTDFLTACPGINKTDAANLLGQFGTMRALATKGTPEELTLVPGLGQVKVTRLYEAFCKPFSKKAARARRLQRQKSERQLNHDDDEKVEMENDESEKETSEPTTTSESGKGDAALLHDGKNKNAISIEEDSRIDSKTAEEKDDS